MFKANKTVCMALDRRFKEWTDLTISCASRNIDVELFFMGTPGTNKYVGDNYDYVDDDRLPPKFSMSTNYATWLNKPAAYNMWRAQEKLFRKVYDGVDYLWLMEDDMGFRDNFDMIAPKLDDYLNNHHVDMLYLGGFGDLSKFGSIYSEKAFELLKLDGRTPYGGFHSVILSKLAIKNLLNFPPIGPFDEISHRFLHRDIVNDTNLVCLAVNPHICCQRSGFSFIEGHHIDRTDQQ